MKKEEKIAKKIKELQESVQELKEMGVGYLLVTSFEKSVDDEGFQELRSSVFSDFKLGDIFQDAAILKEASDTAAFIMEKSDKFLSKDSPLFKKMMKSTHLEDGMLNL